MTRAPRFAILALALVAWLGAWAPAPAQDVRTTTSASGCATGTGTTVIKGNGSGGCAAATSGTDYAPATTGSAALAGNGAGGFAAAATSNLSDVTAPTAWTPTDQSGASLSLTNNGSYVYKLGKLVIATVDITYPTTANGATASILLPAAINSNVLNAVVNGTVQNSSGGVLYFIGSAGAAAVRFSPNLNGAFGSSSINSALSTVRVAFTIIFFTN